MHAFLPSLDSSPYPCVNYPTLSSPPQSQQICVSASASMKYGLLYSVPALPARRRCGCPPAVGQLAAPTDKASSASRASLGPRRVVVEPVARGPELLAHHVAEVLQVLEPLLERRRRRRAFCLRFKRRGGRRSAHRLVPGFTRIRREGGRGGQGGSKRGRERKYTYRMSGS